MKCPLALLALAVVTTQIGCNQALAKDSTTPDQREIELMVYANDFAMVREVRQVDLKQGRGRVGLTDVSKTLDQDSVVFNWPKGDGNEVVSSTYDLGTQDSSRLLGRFLGKQVDLVFRGQNGREAERQSGILEVADPGNIVVRVGDRYLVNPNAEIQAPANAGIVTIPQLTAEIDAKSGGSTAMGMGYLTRGMGWQADYTLTLPKNSTELKLECWATVTNLTGVDYPNAKLKFVAGQPNRAAQPSRYRWGSGGAMPAIEAMDVSGYTDKAKNEMSPIAVGELHAYPYEAKASIQQDQKNRVRMMSADGVQVKRDYSIALPGYDWGFAANPGQRISATLAIKFTNDKSSGLGDPLPAGAIRVYEPGEGGALAYIGAATLRDTPKDAKIDVTLSSVFDNYAQTRRVSQTKVAKRTTRTVYEVILHNEKKTESTVRLVQPVYGGWKITKESEKSRKLNANLIEWTVAVPAGGEKTLTVAIDTKY